jgi:hypothetical protein
MSVLSYVNADHRRYLAVLATLFLVFLLSPLALAKTDFFRRHSNYFYNAVIYDKYTLAGNDADILFVGDSALVTGLVPSVIEQQTGWTSYNLGVPLTSFAVHRDLVIDSYLAHNSHPKIIILYLSFAAQIWHHDLDRGSLYEGAVTLLWHDNFKRNLEFYGQNPGRLVAVSATILRSFVGGFDAHSRSWESIHQRLIAENGFLPSDALSKLPPLQPNQLNAIDVVPDKEYIAHFRSKYSKAGYLVLVAISPVAACDPSFENVVRAYQDLIDLPPYILPCNGFTADGRAHMFRWAAEQSSFVFSKILNEALDRNQLAIPGRPRT